MGACYAEEKRCFACGDESNAMLQDHLFQAEVGPRSLSDQLHLALRHRLMRFILDPGDFASVLQCPDNSPKID